MSYSFREFVPPVLSELDRGWVAGIIEGEGSISFNIDKRRDPHIYRGRVSVQMSDKDILERLLRITACGAISNSIIREHRRDTWTWAVNSSSQVGWLLSQIFDIMSYRRQEQIKEVLSKSAGS